MHSLPLIIHLSIWPVIDGPTGRAIMIINFDYILSPLSPSFPRGSHDAPLLSALLALSFRWPCLTVSHCTDHHSTALSSLTTPFSGNGHASR